MASQEQLQQMLLAAGESSSGSSSSSTSNDTTTASDESSLDEQEQEDVVMEEADDDEEEHHRQAPNSTFMNEDDDEGGGRQRLEQQNAGNVASSVGSTEVVDEAVASRVHNDDAAAAAPHHPPSIGSAATASSVASMPVKMRIKLSLRMPQSPERTNKKQTANPIHNAAEAATALSADKQSTPGTTATTTTTTPLLQNSADAIKTEESGVTEQVQGSTPSSTKSNDATENENEKHAALSASTKNEETDNEEDDEEEEDDGEEIVKATVLNSSDEGGESIMDVPVRIEAMEEQPTVVQLPPPPKTATSSTARGGAASTAKKSRASSLLSSNKPSLPLHARPVRLPPLSSPGMLIPPTSSVYRGSADLNGYSTPASVFDHCMSLAGYTTESRRTNPHRGSSVRRQVGDMFDTNVSFALHFPPLVPKELWSLDNNNNQKEEPSTEQDLASEHPSKNDHAQTTNAGQEPSLAKTAVADAEKSDASPTNGNEDPSPKSETNKNEESIKRDAAELLLRSLVPPHCSETQENGHHHANTETSSRKRRRPLQFSDMVPLSLTLPFPESYVQKRLRYVEKVKERELAIVVSQEANEKYENSKEQYTLISTAKRSNSDDLLPPPPVPPEPTTIPPIPEPPSPPRLSELKAIDFDGLDESKHPVYLPKNHETFTAHLDPACFEITGGRYFNILSNSIADPNFVGPNAPGIAGLNLAGGSGLATAYSSNVTSGGSASTLNAAYYGSVGGGSSTPGGGTSGKSTGNKSSSKKSSSGPASGKSTPSDVVGTQDDGAHGGPSPTATSTGLKKLMDYGGDSANEMRRAIIRAAVYACRVGKHGMSFVGPNGEVYPDVGKAFAAHAGVRPCARCKNNKQGAYHCRLRRRHKDLDHDGGNSPAILKPLFEEPLEHLLLNDASLKIG